MKSPCRPVQRHSIRDSSTYDKPTKINTGSVTPRQPDPPPTGTKTNYEAREEEVV